MPAKKILPYQEWIKKNTRMQKPKQPWDPYIRYIQSELFAKREYPDFYPLEQAQQEFYADLAQTFDEAAKKLYGRLSQKAPPPKKNGGGKQGEKDKDKDKDKDTSAKGDQDSDGDKDDKKSGSGSKSFSSEKPTTVAGNVIQAKKVKPEAFNNKVEFGNLELRSVFLKMRANPDISLKAEGDQELADDRMQWGIVRPSRAMKMSNDNITEWNAAEMGSPWLGFVRIGRRVDKDEDKLVLIQLVHEGSARGKFTIPISELKAGEQWHKVWLDLKFDAKKDPQIKNWNGWNLDDLKKDKLLRLSETGCFFGFFLIKADEKNPNHYFNFRCASLNQFANASFTDALPSTPLKKMTGRQHQVYRNLIEATRGGMSPRMDELRQTFPGDTFRRGAVDAETTSKKLPRSWAKVIVETIQKL